MFSYTPDRRKYCYFCYWTLQTKARRSFRLTKQLVVLTCALMLDVIDLKRRLAKSLKFNWNMLSLVFRMHLIDLCPEQLYHIFNKNFNDLHDSTRGQPLCIVIVNLIISIGKVPVSALSLNSTLLSLDEINKSLLLYVAAAMASTCCWHPGVCRFWRTFVSHHTLGRIANLQLRFVEIFNVLIRIPRYI